MIVQEVWCEGDPRLEYTACHVGSGRGETLLEVCNDLATRSVSFDRHWNRRQMTYLGCKLHLSEEAARDAWN